MMEVTVIEVTKTAKLAVTIRAADGVIHRYGETVTIVRQVDKLGRAMLLVAFNDASRGYVFPEELEEHC